MIVVTGAAGFIGSNLSRALALRGYDVLAVDDLTDGTKFSNLADALPADYLDKSVFLERLKRGEIPKPQAIFHQGACSDTMEWDGRFMLENNFEYSKQLLHYCLEQEIPLIYASSAATYGGNQTFKESPEFEAPLNVYGYSKLLFDQYVRRLLPQGNSQIAGLRYFNVYGPREQHKGNMASVAFHFNNQLLANGQCRLFAGVDGYADGEQQRDFVYVDDVVSVNLWLLDNPGVSGVFNCGTGRHQAFNDVADAVLRWHRAHDREGEKVYISFPDKLKGRYQSYTCADMHQLRAAGYTAEFNTVEQGVTMYLDWLAEQSTKL